MSNCLYFIHPSNPRPDYIPQFSFSFTLLSLTDDEMDYQLGLERVEEAQAGAWLILRPDSLYWQAG